MTTVLVQGGTAVRAAVRDPIVRSSAFLFLAHAMTAAFGFGFWALAARLYSTEEIGVSSALLSAISLLSYLSLVGLNNLVIAKGSELHRTSLFAAAFSVVGVLGLAGGVLYILGVRVVSPGLAAAASDPVMIVFFALAAWGAAVNVLTDSVFVARSAAHYNLWLNSFLQGAVRLTCLVLAVGLGAAGLVFASGLAVTLTGIASVVVIGRVLRIPVWSPPRREVVAGAVPFLAGTYVSSLLYLIPLIVVPLVLIRQAGAAGNAHYFVAFQIAMLLYASADAVGQSVFAQAAGGGPRRSVLRRSAAVLGLVTVSGMAAGELLARPVLSLFGPEYAEHSVAPLRFLLLAALPVALNVWTSFVCRIYHCMRTLVLANAACLLTTVGLTLLWAGRSLVLVALAWALGNLVAALVDTAGLLLVIRSRGRTERT